MYLQGDVVLVPVAGLPKDKKAKNRMTVAYGEVTGHSHRFDKNAKVYESGSMLYVQVSETAVLRHEEHPPLTVEPGIYEVRPTREYQWGQERRVLD